MRSRREQTVEAKDGPNPLHHCKGLGGTAQAVGVGGRVERRNDTPSLARYVGGFADSSLNGSELGSVINNSSQKHGLPPSIRLGMAEVLLEVCLVGGE